MHLNTTLLLIALCILSHIQIIASYEVYDDDALVDTTPQFNLFGIVHRARRPRPKPPTPEDPEPEPIPTIDPVPDPTEPDEPSPRRPRPAPKKNRLPAPLQNCKEELFLSGGACDKSYDDGVNALPVKCRSKLRLARNPTNIFRYSITIDNCACEPVRLYDACMGFTSVMKGYKR